MGLDKFLKYNASSSGNCVSRRVYLKALDAGINDVPLLDGENEIGRSKETNIRESLVSKRQLSLKVNFDQSEINVKTVGLNPSGLNGFMLTTGSNCTAKHGDIIEVVYDRFKYEIIFDPPPEAKRLATYSYEDEEQIENTYGHWESVDNGKLVIYNALGIRASNKIAAFDMDGTIIKTKSGNVFPKNTFDWEILYPTIPEKLKRMHEDGYKVCFFTNQAGIAKGKVKLDDFKGKIVSILKRLNVPVQVFIATGEGIYRKPVPGMWKYLQDEKNNGVPVSLENSFFVGDAAGRPEVGSGTLKRKKDHSSADRLFASNVGINFLTPEEHFLNKRVADWIRPDFDPTESASSPSLYQPTNTKVPAHECELIVMVGLPGSGKSHYVENVLKKLGYSVFNADTMGSVQATINACERAIQGQRKCVIDNTNVDVDSRKKLLAIANKYKVPCRAFLMNTSPGHIKHNLAFRLLTDTKHSKINEMILNTMKKKFTKPNVEEGFKDVVEVNISYIFQNPEEEALYKMFLVEK